MRLPIWPSAPIRYPLVGGYSFSHRLHASLQFEHRQFPVPLRSVTGELETNGVAGVTDWDHLPISGTNEPRDENGHQRSLRVKNLAGP